MMNLALKNSLRILILSMALAPVLAHAAVLTQTDTSRNCQEYRVLNDDPESKADEVADALAQGATLVNDSPTMGFSLRNLRIDFAGQNVTVDIRQHIFLGFDRMILKDVTIPASDEKLTAYVNQLNHDFFLSRSLCVNTSNELVSFE